jgi:hypothetical protein
LKYPEEKNRRERGDYQYRKQSLRVYENFHTVVFLLKIKFQNETKNQNRNKGYEKTEKSYILMGIQRRRGRYCQRKIYLVRIYGEINQRKQDDARHKPRKIPPLEFLVQNYLRRWIRQRRQTDENIDRVRADDALSADLPYAVAEPPQRRRKKIARRREFLVD